LLADAGIETRVIPTPTGDSDVGRAATWAVLRGTGERRPIVLLSHLDVVPAESSAWEHPPFAGVRDGDFVFGRGALDAKGVTVVHLLALLKLSQRDAPLKRRAEGWTVRGSSHATDAVCWARPNTCSPRVAEFWFAARVSPRSGGSAWSKRVRAGCGWSLVERPGIALCHPEMPLFPA
jgi:hypothetical protein